MSRLFLLLLQEFAADRTQFLPPWVLYFSGCEERDRLLAALDRAWRAVFQVMLRVLTHRNSPS